MAVLLASLVSLILPLWLVRSMVGLRETLQVWPALLVSGLSFAGMQFYWSNFQDPGLVDVVAAIFSLLVMVALLAGLPVRKTIRIFKITVVQMIPSLLAISFMVGLAYVTRYSGMDTLVGLIVMFYAYVMPSMIPR
jgi:L-lactate permease